VTTSTRVGAGLPFAERHCAVMLAPASTQVTRAGSSPAAVRSGLRADVGIPAGAGVSVVIGIHSKRQRSRSATDDCGGDSTTWMATAQDSGPSSGREPSSVDGRCSHSTCIVRIQVCRGCYPTPNQTSTAPRTYADPPRCTSAAAPVRSVPSRQSSGHWRIFGHLCDVVEVRLALQTDRVRDLPNRPVNTGLIVE
jgi:hypothetical protein